MPSSSTPKLKTPEEKVVTLTLEDLCIILASSAAKIHKVDPNNVDSYVAAYKKDYLPVANYIYERQRQAANVIALS